MGAPKRWLVGTARKPVPEVWPGTKNGENHRVWLPVPVPKLLTEIAGDNRPAVGFVFAGFRGRSVHGLDRAMRQICSIIKVEKATPHDLRRTHGTTIAGLGFGRDAMNWIQNHREGGIASVYDRHQYADENKHVMEAVGQRIMALVEGREGTGNVVSLR